MANRFEQAPTIERKNGDKKEETHLARFAREQGFEPEEVEQMMLLLDEDISSAIEIKTSMMRRVEEQDKLYQFVSEKETFDTLKGLQKMDRDEARADMIAFIESQPGIDWTRVREMAEELEVTEKKRKQTGNWLGEELKDIGLDFESDIVWAYERYKDTKDSNETLDMEPKDMDRFAKAVAFIEANPQVISIIEMQLMLET